MQCQKYNEGKPIASLHVPKCGGQSLMLILRKWFGRKLFIHSYNEVTGKQLRQLPPKSIVHGHFQVSEGKIHTNFYSNINQKIVFIRDPFEMSISSYFYTKQNVHLWPEKPTLFPNIDKYIENILVKKSHFLFEYLPPLNIDESILSFVDREFAFTGVFDHFQQSVDDLAIFFNKPITRLPHINAAIYDEAVPDLRREFRATFKKEYDLYDLVLSRISTK
jgi:hypothetical protein